MKAEQRETNEHIDFAISETEYKEFGCPVCGYAFSAWGFKGGGGTAVLCKNKLCEARFYILIDGHKEFDGFGFSHKDTDGRYVHENIKLKSHPRKGTPARGRREDKRPANGGEFFTNPKGSEYRHGLCFICQAPCKLPINTEWPMKSLFSITVETPCKEAAKRVNFLFDKVKLWSTRVGDGREEPFESYFVSISSCHAHYSNLLKLKEIAQKEGVITEKILRKVKALK